MRAVMQNRDLASVSGLPTSRVDAITFFLGSALAGVAGVAVSLIGPIGTATGNAYILSAFLVVIVGGLGKLRQRWPPPCCSACSTPTSSTSPAPPSARRRCSPS
ncbi:MAG: hypothetical protein R2749_10760 [Acidimicrobiales bacterium]